VKRALLAFPLLAALGCDALVDQTYRGTPLDSERFVVANESGREATHPRAAVFWADSMAATSLDEMHEQTSSSQPVRDGESYVLNIFEQPSTLVPWLRDDPDGPKFAIGRLAVYDDLNRNARRDDDEPMVGGLGPYGVIYAPSDLPAEGGYGRRDVPVGLHVAWLPLPCKPDPAPNSDTCDVPIGRACSGPMQDAPCGPGVCVDRFNFPWPGGACLVEQKRGCIPAAGALLNGGPGGPYFAQACQDDTECDRGTPYRCDPLAGACVPFNVPRISLGDIPFAAFCGGS
jgi:hypothetical protein